MKYLRFIRSNAFWKGAAYTSLIFNCVMAYQSSNKIGSVLEAAIGFVGVFLLGYFIRETEKRSDKKC
jgi:membrane protease YdiL (CAAX protease family)